MAREPEARISGPPERDQRVASGEQIAMVLLAAAAVVLVVVGVARPGAGPALAVGSVAGALALVLVARRSMEAFVLLVLVLRPALDGLHAPAGVAVTDPARAARRALRRRQPGLVGRPLAGGAPPPLIGRRPGPRRLPRRCRRGHAR